MSVSFNSPLYAFHHITFTTPLINQIVLCCRFALFSTSSQLQQSLLWKGFANNGAELRVCRLLSSPTSRFLCPTISHENFNWLLDSRYGQNPYDQRSTGQAPYPTGGGYDNYGGQQQPQGYGQQSQGYGQPQQTSGRQQYNHGSYNQNQYTQPQMGRDDYNSTYQSGD